MGVTSLLCLSEALDIRTADMFMHGSRGGTGIGGLRNSVLSTVQIGHWRTCPGKDVSRSSCELLSRLPDDNMLWND